MYGSASLIDYVNRIRAPFCCNALVQAAGIAALEDTSHQAAVLAHQQKMLPWFMKKLTDLGYTYVPSVTNFVLVEFPAEGPCTAQTAYLRLAKDGYIVRPVDGYGLPNHLRITLGLQEHMDNVVHILDTFLHDSSGQYDIKQHVG
jgi:histidinol-phosphate aminotransferase